MDQYINYVRRMSLSASQPYRFFISPAESIQIGWSAFLEATKRWDGIGTLEGFTSARIKGAMVDELRRVFGRGGARKPPILFGGLESYEMDELLAYEEPEECEYTMDELLEPVTNCRQRFVLMMYYSYDLSLCRIADIMGVSESVVLYIKSDGMEVLRHKHNVKTSML